MRPLLNFWWIHWHIYQSIGSHFIFNRVAQVRGILPDAQSWYREAVHAIAATHRHVFSKGELQKLLDTLKEAGAVPTRISLRRFMDVLESEVGLREHVISAAHVAGASDPPYRPFRRHLLGTASPEEVSLSLRPRSYLSHASALRAHGIPTAPELPVFANQEQRPKPTPNGDLTQAAINRAFQNGPRISQYVFEYQGTQLALLAGKNTGNYRVTEVRHPEHVAPLLVADLPRTLVDIAVRPAYAGGPLHVLHAYRHVVDRIGGERLVAELCETLDALRHVYPYHQALGYYLMRAEVNAKHLIPLRNRGAAYDFYLCNRIADPVYIPSWSIYVPRDLEIA